MNTSPNAMTKITDLFAPVPMYLRQIDGHFPKISDFLPLEPVQVGLQCHGRVFEILCCCLIRVFKLGKLTISGCTKMKKKGKMVLLVRYCL